MFCYNLLDVSSLVWSNQPSLTFPEADTAIVTRGRQNGAGDIPADSPHGTDVVIELCRYLDVEPWCIALRTRSVSIKSRLKIMMRYCI